MTKRGAFFCLAALNLAAAFCWLHMGLDLRASGPSGMAGLFFLGLALMRRPLRAPTRNATPKEKALYNLRLVAALVGADELILGGWRLRVGAKSFRVFGSRIYSGGRSTCYQMQGGAPEAEKIATALLYLKTYPQAWDFWAAHHGIPWKPPTRAVQHGTNYVTSSY